MIVKVCGIKNLEELEIVERYADATGVVVKSNSKRCVDLDKAKEIIDSSTIPVFAVSTARSYEEWEEIIAKTECNMVQVHSDMPVEEFEKLKDMVKVMKAFIVDKPANEISGLIEIYSPHLILLDSGCGSGEVHDWRISREIAKKHEVFLAGGLNVENVVDAINIVKPVGVDVSSGVERDGLKDEELVREFVRRAKNEVW
ncbi:MAG: phosphoribosylanthranilate isomerase [Thermococcaceae archaeon]|jgi:phosphoribosylanthranilate isomerase|uniref:phosphoribosylanthranilate isomerase n=1 Tax=Thermococcus sp. PK TaxID=913025 RepID=UPI0005B2C4A0|nr:phosphoribosylanthranilate isomerase [Thermococcus sp. PK]MDK2853153.1 phosphoribosylanthranilate isomerase [Thermococcaceae archaeon]MDN5319590.1 phosphoribosylanthranilate isomerase [Thermococcaceae archaeon]